VSFWKSSLQYEWGVSVYLQNEQNIDNTKCARKEIVFQGTLNRKPTLTWSVICQKPIQQNENEHFRKRLWYCCSQDINLYSILYRHICFPKDRGDGSCNWLPWLPDIFHVSPQIGVPSVNHFIVGSKHIQSFICICWGNPILKITIWRHK